MVHGFSIGIEIVLALLSLAGLGYYTAALLATRAYAREVRKSKPPDASVAHGISVLKPLRGFDANMYEAFRSHCLQEYEAPFEIIFGVASLDDPAVPAVERLKAEFPKILIELVECPQNLGANGKVSALAQMLPHARYDFLVINDSDMFVPPLYLRHIMDAFAPHDVGMVTALYRGHTVPNHHGRRTVWSKLEALTLSTEFLPGILLAKHIEKEIRFALGATLAIRRSTLQRIGGFLPLVNRLADDYELGVRTVATGERVALTPDVVTTAIPAYHWRGFLSHQLRWLRTVRDERPHGYFGICFTFGTVWALLAVLASAADPWSIALLSLVLVGRYAVALAAGLGIAADRQILRDWWLIVPRDILGAALWLASYAGNTVEWRGIKFQLKNGELIHLQSSEL